MKLSPVLGKVSFSSSPSMMVSPLFFNRSRISAKLRRRPSVCSASCCASATMPAICGLAMLVPASATCVPFKPVELMKAPGAKTSDSLSSRCEKATMASVTPIWTLPQFPALAHTAPTDKAKGSDDG